MALVLFALLLIFFVTPNKYLGFGGWGAGLLLVFVTALLLGTHPFREWLTWVSLLGGIACLGIWALQRASPGEEAGDEASK